VADRLSMSVIPFRRKVKILEGELAELRRQIDELANEPDCGDAAMDGFAVARHPSAGNISRVGETPMAIEDFELDDDDVQAQAFDDFFAAYDESHDETRKFLLG